MKYRFNDLSIPNGSKSRDIQDSGEQSLNLKTLSIITSSLNACLREEYFLKVSSKLLLCTLAKYSTALQLNFNLSFSLLISNMFSQLFQHQEQHAFNNFFNQFGFVNNFGHFKPLISCITCKIESNFCLSQIPYLPTQ